MLRKNLEFPRRFQMLCKAIAGFLVSVASLALTAHSQTHESPLFSSAPGWVCSNQTMRGTWGSSIEGTVVGPNIQFRGLALQYFDGRGHITQVDHIVNDGVPPNQDWTAGTGTYTVNPDCTGSAVINSGSNPYPIVLHFIVVENGNKWLQVIDANVANAIGYRIN
jgi:hypothetical protein